MTFALGVADVLAGPAGATCCLTGVHEPTTVVGVHGAHGLAPQAPTSVSADRKTAEEPAARPEGAEGSPPGGGGSGGGGGGSDDGDFPFLLLIGLAGAGACAFALTRQRA